MNYLALLQLMAQMRGEQEASTTEGKQQQLLQDALKQYDSIGLPDLSNVTAEQVGDPDTMGAQRDALNELLRIGKAGGMTLEDQANLNSIRGQQARSTTQGMDRVREQMAARGIRGGGAELSMQLAGNQGAAQRASDDALKVRADAQKHALDSIVSGGRMAGDMTSATDARNRYNADARSRAQMYNAGLGQQQFNNQMARAAGRSGQVGGLSNFYGNQAMGQRAYARGMGQAGANAVGGNYGNAKDPYAAAPQKQANASGYTQPDDQWDNLQPATPYTYG